MYQKLCIGIKAITTECDIGIQSDKKLLEKSTKGQTL